MLTALNRVGYTYLVGCRRGGCGICKADLLNGSVTYPVVVSTDVLSDAEREEGTCLTCRAVPSGDVEIALRTELRAGYLTRFLNRQADHPPADDNNTERGDTP